MTSTSFNHPVHFTRKEFRDYVAGLSFDEWRPELLFMDNTIFPSLKQWKAMGSTPQERWGSSSNQYHRRFAYYTNPHVVVCPEYIWVLCDLTKPGGGQNLATATSWTVEMIGDYDADGDSLSSNDGSRVRDNAAFALAVIAEKLDMGDLANFALNLRGLHFPRDCKEELFARPGEQVTKTGMLPRIATFRKDLASRTQKSLSYLFPSSAAKAEREEWAVSEAKTKEIT